jgi:hypothetical protein
LLAAAFALLLLQRRPSGPTKSRNPRPHHPWRPAGALERAEQGRGRQTEGRHAALHACRGIDGHATRPRGPLLQFTELSQEYPELPDPYNNIALLLARAGRLNEALQALQRRCATTQATARRVPIWARCT